MISFVLQVTWFVHKKGKLQSQTYLRKKYRGNSLSLKTSAVSLALRRSSSLHPLA